MFERGLRGVAEGQGYTTERASLTTEQLRGVMSADLTDTPAPEYAHQPTDEAVGR